MKDKEDQHVQYSLASSEVRLAVYGKHQEFFERLIEMYPNIRYRKKIGVEKPVQIYGYTLKTEKIQDFALDHIKVPRRVSC